MCNLCQEILGPVEHVLGAAAALSALETLLQDENPAVRPDQDGIAYMLGVLAARLSDSGSTLMDIAIKH